MVSARLNKEQHNFIVRSYICFFKVEDIRLRQKVIRLGGLHMTFLASRYSARVREHRISSTRELRCILTTSTLLCLQID